jgi:hypothetical protein
MGHFFGLYITLYYIFKKSSKVLEKEERKTWLNWRLRPLVVVSVVFNIGVVLYLEIQYARLNSGKTTQDLIYSLSCLSPLWLSSSLFEFLTVLIFLCFVFKLEK